MRAARRWRMIRVEAGDYLCPSNDRAKLWRFHTYVDGRVFGLDVGFEERTFWRAVWMLMPVDLAELPGPWAPAWVESDWYLPTRAAAIGRMLDDDDEVRA